MPSATELATRPDQTQILKLILIGQEMARPFAAPPGIPADRKAALIAAFERTNADPEFLAEAQRLDLDVNPVSAGKLDALAGGGLRHAQGCHRQSRQGDVGLSAVPAKRRRDR